MSIARTIPRIATGARVEWSTHYPDDGGLRRAWRNTWARAGALALGALLHSSAVMAGTAAANMPWNAPLQNLLNNLTGPTARAAVGIGVAICGVIWMMKRHEEGAGRLGQVVIGGALVLGAQVFAGAIGFAGALV